MTTDRKLELVVVPDDSPPVLHGTHLEPRARALAREVRFYFDRPLEPDVLLERIRDAEAVINIRATSKFTRHVLEACPRLKLVSVWGVGVDNIDLAAATRLGITVSNTPGYASIGVAEHALTLALSVARQIITNDRLIRSGSWSRGWLVQLYGKTLGVVGAGPIGQRMVELGRGVGMKVVAWTRKPTPERARQLGVEFLPLEELLRQSDVVSLHLPLTDETRGLLNRERLALMKPTAILVNTGRGPLIDEAALTDALREKRLAGAGLDVFATEPLPKGHPLTTLDNVVLSPHAAQASPETTLRGVEMSIENIESFLRGQPIRVVNPQ
ncbi:MAG: phosphoglycerate dehydrogenase [Chloroflexota bacterium]|nr:phosphoglycerate dehydrogenase [Chloroflexota bacterium]